MTMTADKYAKVLRQQIVLTIKSNYPGTDHHDLIATWGYGNRLSKIYDISILKEIKDLANGLPVYDANIGKLDAQGRYVISLMHRIGWDIKRVRQLLIKKTGHGTWLKLKSKQKDLMIKIMKSYIIEDKSTNGGQ